MLKKAVVVLILMILNANLFSFEAKIRVVTEDFPPFNYWEDGQLKGVNTEIVKAVLKLAGIDFFIEIMPWTRAYFTALNESNVLIYTIVRKPDREAFFYWIGPLAKETKWSIYSLKSRNDIQISNFKEIVNYKVGLVRNYAYFPEFRELKNYSNHIFWEEVDDYEHNIKKILAGRIDLLVIPVVSFKKILNDMDLDIAKFKSVYSLSSYATYTCMAFGKKSDPELVEKVRVAFNELKASGEFDKILEAYE